jgi:hypothetical protein
MIDEIHMLCSAEILASLKPAKRELMSRNKVSGGVKAARSDYIRTISRKSRYALDKEGCRGEFGHVVTERAFHCTHTRQFSSTDL